MRLPLGRVLLFWALMFLVAYGSSFFLFHAYVSTSNPFLGVLMQLSSPLIYLVCGWLYYRRANLEAWTPRLLVIPIWIVLSIGLAAVLIKPVYGYDWTLAINANVLKGQSLNIAAMLIAAYVAGKKKVAVGEESDMGSLEGPKF